MACLEAAKTKHIEQVYLFEKARSLLSAAGKYNQARLHLGFHYPLSDPKKLFNNQKVVSLYIKSVFLM